MFANSFFTLILLVLNIVSPEFSFLDFNYIDNDNCGNEQLASLPVCNDLSIKAQFTVETESDTPTSQKLYIAICDDNCNVLYDDDIEVQPICSKYKFLTTFEGENIGVDDPYNLCNTDNDAPIQTVDFLVNPFDEITSNEIEFDMVENPTDGSEFIIYIEDKIYRFARIIGGAVTTIGNITEKKIGAGVQNAQTTFINYMNTNFDLLYGTTTSLLSDTFTISDIPEGCYFQNNGTVTNITGTTPTTNIGKNFIHFDNKVNFNTFSTLGNSYSFESSLTDAQWYEIIIDYNTIYTDIIGTVTFDDGTNPPTVENVLFNEFNGQIKVYYLSALTATHTITIELTDVNGHTNGLSLNSIKVYNSVNYNVTNNISGNIPEGQYTRTELLEIINGILGFDFDCEFISCCEIPEIEFEITLQDDDTVYLFVLSTFWQKGYVNFPELLLDTINQDCFTYGILDFEKNLIACSNLFHKEDDCCFITKMEYSNDEDSFGFTYPAGVTNMISLPFFLHSPSYPTTEKIYKQTNGNYKRLSADIEKEYDCETDYFDEKIHDKLITALKHDTIIVTSNRLGFEDQMTQQGDYDLNWNSNIEFTAMAEFKLKKYFNGKNSNCGANC